MILLAAVLWSLSGAFSKVLAEPTPLGLDSPNLDPLQIAFWRVVFAGLVLIPTVRPTAVRFRWPMVAMVGCFAAMNCMYVSAMMGGLAANAVLLQYAAPLWIIAGSVLFLGEPFDRRNLGLVVVGLVGVGIILTGNWNSGDPAVLALALGSGVMYAGVLIGLRLLRTESAGWLTVVNFLGSAALIAPFVPHSAAPTPAQFGWLFLFGTVQMALPYLATAHGMRHLSPQEVGLLTLLEPVLNPLWAYLASPATETPNVATIAGGVLILAALAWRYRPGQKIRTAHG